ncbi:hypothetical protein ACRRTK_008245 [Alexandromys fortis]
MSSPRGAVHAPLRRSLSEQLRDSTARAWDLLWRNVRERRLTVLVEKSPNGRKGYSDAYVHGLPASERIIERTVKDNSYQQGLFTEHIAEEMGLGLAEKESSLDFASFGVYVVPLPTDECQYRPYPLDLVWLNIFHNSLCPHFIPEKWIAFQIVGPYQVFIVWCGTSSFLFQHLVLHLVAHQSGVSVVSMICRVDTSREVSSNLEENRTAHRCCAFPH